MDFFFKSMDLLLVGYEIPYMVDIPSHGHCRFPHNPQKSYK